MSVAAMERHIKTVFFKDSALQDLRVKREAAVSEIEGLEYDVRVIETDIKIAVGRLTELGGYLQYLAAIKLAQTHSKANETSEAGEVT